MQQTMYLFGICSSTHSQGNLIQDNLDPTRGNEQIQMLQKRSTVWMSWTPKHLIIILIIRYSSITIDNHTSISTSLSIVYTHCAVHVHILPTSTHPAQEKSQKKTLLADSMSRGPKPPRCTIKSPSWQWFWIWTSHSASPMPDTTVDTAASYYAMPINIQHITT